MIVSTVLPNLVPQHRIDDCVEIHILHWELWFTDIWSPTFSALGTTAPVRFLQGGLVIFILKQMSQLRSFGKWVKIVCLPDTTFARSSEDNSWEELGACRCSGTLSSTRFSLNSSTHSGTSRNGSLRIPLLSFFIRVFGFCWSTRRVSSFSITHTLTSCWCVMVRTCRRCRCNWARRTCRWTKDNEWYAVRRGAFYPSAIFDELWFLTTGPMVSIHVIFAEFSE